MAFNKTEKTDSPMRKKAVCAEERKFAYSAVKIT